MVTASQRPLQVQGNRFVLTGRMWTERRRIIDQIEAAGGWVDDRIRSSRNILIIADNRLVKDAHGDWHTRGQSTLKADAALERGCLVYPEAALKHALTVHRGAGVLPHTAPFQGTSVVKPPITPQPKWGGEMARKVQANLKEAAEALADF